MFYGDFSIMQIREVGQTKTHYSCKLKTQSGSVFQAIYFNAKQSADEPTAFSIGDTVQCTYQPSLNHFAGRTTLQLRIQSMQ